MVDWLQIDMLPFVFLLFKGVYGLDVWHSLISSL